MKKSISVALILVPVILIWSCKKVDNREVRDNYVSVYNVTETWTEDGHAQSKPAFTMLIEKSSQDIRKVLLINFANYGAGISAMATINDFQMVIPQQTLPGPVEISGTATLSGQTLTIIYTETAGSTSFVVTATAIKL